MNTLEYILHKYKLTMSNRIEIPNVGRNDLASLLPELNFKIGVEVGVSRGFYSEVLCKTNPQMKIYGVDPWESFENSKNNSTDKRTENAISQEMCDEYYRSAMNLLRPYRNYHIIKEYSVDAVNKFEDGSLDFVYIDANHQYPFVLEDITKWSKKVRKGGIVSGHDYYDTVKNQTYAKQTVNYYVKTNRITPLIIWGLKNSPPGMYRDKWRSWMWVS